MNAHIYFKGLTGQCKQHKKAAWGQLAGCLGFMQFDTHQGEHGKLTKALHCFHVYMIYIGPIKAYKGCGGLMQ